MLVAVACIFPFSLFISIRDFCYCFLLFFPRDTSIWTIFFFSDCTNWISSCLFFGDWRVILIPIYSSSWLWSCINDTIFLTGNFTKCSIISLHFMLGTTLKTSSFLIKLKWFFLTTHIRKTLKIVKSQTDLFKCFSNQIKFSYLGSKW